MSFPTSVFITGIGGFIGLRLAERLRAMGIAVRGIDHDRAAIDRARGRAIDAQLGDLSDEARLRSLIDGADAVVHTAAIVREHGRLEEFRRVNVEGSRAVASAARAAGARAFVQLSSVMVYGFDYPMNVDEAGPLRGEGNPYCQTKIESEQIVAALQSERFGVIIIRPGDVYGPGSVPWVERPTQMMRKRLMLLPNRGSGMINHIYVDNLVDGILLALEKQAYGETFNITDGVATTYAEYFGRLARIANVPGPIAVPTAVMNVLVRALSLLASVGLSRDDASPDTVRYLLRPHAYSIRKARTMLGFQPRIDLNAGLVQTRPFIEQLMSRQA